MVGPSSPGPNLAGSEAWPELGPILYDRSSIAARVRAIGAQISRDYEGRAPVLVTVLKGATVFAADLARSLTLQHEMDFLAISAYGEAESVDQARVLKDLQVPVTGRDVILVEDVVDTGLTLRFLLRWLERQEPATLEVCTLLDRPHRRLADIDIAYRGFTVPDRFYVGYGFDYRHRYRNLPDLHELLIDQAGLEQLLGD